MSRLPSHVPNYPVNSADTGAGGRVRIDADLDAVYSHAGRRLLVLLSGLLGIGGGWLLFRGLRHSTTTTGTTAGSPEATAAAVAVIVAVALASVCLVFEGPSYRGAVHPGDQGPGCTLLAVRRTPRLALGLLLMSPAALLVTIGSPAFLLALAAAAYPLVRLVRVDTRVRLDPIGVGTRRRWRGTGRRIDWDDVEAVVVTRSVRPQLLVLARHGVAPLAIDVLSQRWTPSAIGACLQHFATYPRERDLLTDARSVDRFRTPP